MGTPDFAVAPLKVLHESGYHIVAVVTMPDKPAGRGLKLKSSPVKEYALANGLELLQPERLKEDDFISKLNTLHIDLGIVVAFKMLPKVVWSLPKFGTFNLHASLLPQYRGAAPINWAIMNGDQFTGVTTFLLDKDIDTGDLIISQRVDIGEDETAGELHDKLMEVGSRVVLETVDKIAEGSIGFIAQSSLMESELRPAPKIFREDCLIDWSDPIDVIFNKVRGLSPYPGALCTIKGVDYKVFSAEKQYDNSVVNYGELFTDEKSFVKISCNAGYLSLKEIQAPGKKRMDILSFLRGNKL